MKSVLLWSMVCALVGCVQSRLTRDMVFTKEVSNTYAHPEARDSPSPDVDTVEEVEVPGGNETERDSRGLLKKLTLLAGLKSGGLISTSGTLAASNSIRIFGKVMNSALSVSYGHVDDLDPLPEVQHDTQGQDDKEVRQGSTSRPPLTAVRHNFIKNHNAQVSRINHKFLRSDSLARKA